MAEIGVMKDHSIWDWMTINLDKTYIRLYDAFKQIEYFQELFESNTKWHFHKNCVCVCVCVLLKHIHCWIHHSYFLSSKRNLNRKLKFLTSSCPFNKSNKSKGEALNSCYCHHLPTFFNNTTLSNWQRDKPRIFILSS